MLNYTKSELYRVFHGKELYRVTGVMAGLTVLMNLVLFGFKTFTTDFPYGVVRFSLNNLIGSMLALALAGAVVTTFLFADEHKNGTLKNVVSYGISRTEFFTGKCIVCSIASFFSMIMVYIVYVGGAYLLLDEKDLQPAQELLVGTAALMPVAIAFVVLAVMLYCMFKKEGTAVLIWWAILWAIPTACNLIGLKVDSFAKIASWMPWNYLNSEVTANMSGYDCLWNTPEGLGKCIISGLIGLVIFYMAGILFFRKKEIA